MQKGRRTKKEVYSETYYNINLPLYGMLSVISWADWTLKTMQLAIFESWTGDIINETQFPSSGLDKLECSQINSARVAYRPVTRDPELNMLGEKCWKPMATS